MRTPKKWGFQGFTDAIELPHEGQIDTGKCMQSLLQLCQAEGVLILNNIEVWSIVDQGAKAELNNQESFTPDKWPYVQTVLHSNF